MKRKRRRLGIEMGYGGIDTVGDMGSRLSIRVIGRNDSGVARMDLGGRESRTQRVE
jgi:hypothetical protein